jgi:hypothetical protein
MSPDAVSLEAQAGAEADRRTRDHGHQEGLLPALRVDHGRPVHVGSDRQADPGAEEDRQVQVAGVVLAAAAVVQSAQSGPDTGPDERAQQPALPAHRDLPHVEVPDALLASVGLERDLLLVGRP